jgi:perosamine synthetase
MKDLEQVFSARRQEEVGALLASDGADTLWTFRGRGALATLLTRLGLGSGAKVGLQAFTCSAVPEGIIAAGCSPVYIDIDPERLTMNPVNAGIAIKDLAALVVQHTYGIMADMSALTTIANEAGIPIIEDCCHTYFSITPAGARAGTLGHAAFYSLEWGKPLVAGIGGIGTINRPDQFAAALDDLTVPSWQAQLQIELQYAAFSAFYRPSLYWPIKRAFHALSRFGIGRGNYTINEMSVDDSTDQIEAVPSPEFGWKTAPSVRRRASRGLDKLVQGAKHSRSIAAIYAAGLPDSVQLKSLANDTNVLVRFPILLENKDAALEFAAKSMFEVSEWYRTPVHPYPANSARLVRYQAGSCPNAEEAGERVVTLPLNLRTSDKQAREIAKGLSEFLSL